MNTCRRLVSIVVLAAALVALVLVLEGQLSLTIGGTAVTATPGTIVRMPANVPHAVEATTPARMLLVMIREPKAA